MLSTQLDYIYSTMDDNQKRSMDYSTQNYLERILHLKSSFTMSVKELIHNSFTVIPRRMDKERVEEAAELMQEILQGEYVNQNGEERLQIADDKYIKINFTSSGQQEVLWILNVLFFHLLNKKNAYFIIEEPESHLFPNAQKLIAEFISLVYGAGENRMFITTHSPYILGAFNNLLYADKISSVVGRRELEEIIPWNRWLPFSKEER